MPYRREVIGSKIYEKKGCEKKTMLKVCSLVFLSLLIHKHLIIFLSNNYKLEFQVMIDCI